MTRTSAWALVVIAVLVEILMNVLFLSEERLQHQHTIIAGCVLVAAWLAAGLAADGQVRSHASAASSLVKWPVFVGLGGWGVVSGFIMLSAASMSMKVLLSLHGFLGLGALVLAVVMRSAAQHVDKVELEVARTDGAHVDLNAAVAKARTVLGRAGLDGALTQRVRIALDRTQTVPRSALAGPGGEPLLMTVRKLALALETAGDVGAAVVQLEDAVVAVKGR